MDELGFELDLEGYREYWLAEELRAIRTSGLGSLSTKSLNCESPREVRDLVWWREEEPEVGACRGQGVKYGIENLMTSCHSPDQNLLVGCHHSPHAIQSLCPGPQGSAGSGGGHLCLLPGSLWPGHSGLFSWTCQTLCLLRLSLECSIFNTWPYS